jgi:hypothetical protein
MPAKSRWLLQIPVMLQTLHALETPIVDRLACERLFGVGRRRAIYLMQQFGGYRAGNAILLDRLELIRRLEEVGSSPGCEIERARKQKLSDSLNAVHRHCTAAQIPIPVTPVARDRCVDDLPAGVRLEPGRLCIEFNGSMQLLSSLYELSQAATNDYDRFCATAEGRRH